MKMVKTKCVKEMAKELFTLFSGKVNSVLAQAIENDEQSIKNIDSKGNITNDKIIYSDDFDVIPQGEVDDTIQNNEEVTQVDFDEIPNN